jgi:16S rRNA (guanine527-N7)-methyltransferase
VTATRDEAYETAAKLGVSRESWGRIDVFVQVLTLWQKSFNLVSEKSLSDIWTRHVIDSLQVLPLLNPQTRGLADLGSGSGFPGVPLAIAAGVNVHLFESNAKKAAFLREVLRQTETSGTVHLMRLEDINHEELPVVQAITARALAPLNQLLTWSFPLLETGAPAFFHKGQDLDNELTEAAKYWRLKVKRHESMTDSHSAILEVQEAHRAN